MLARVVLWNLADSKTTLEELRAWLPAAAGRDAWISDDATERFGLITFAEEGPDLTRLIELIGKQPELVEVFDVEQ